MNTDERKAFIKDVVDVLEARVIRPLEVRLDRRLTELEKKDSQRSGQHHAVTTEIVPRAVSEMKAARDGDNAGIAAAVNSLGRTLTEVAQRTERIEAELQPRATVELPDGKGGKSIRPASLVAAESSVRTENKQEIIANKQDSIGKMVLDAALETTKAKDSAVSTKRRATVTLVVGLIAGAAEIYSVISHALAASGAPHP